MKARAIFELPEMPNNVLKNIKHYERSAKMNKFLEELGNGNEAK